jgi:hypothetical protein
MEGLVGAVQDRLEAAARAVDSALQEAGPRPSYTAGRLARLAAPHLLVLESPVFRHLLLCSSLVAAKAALLAAALQLLRLGRGPGLAPQEGERRVEAALAGDSAQLALFLALGLAYTATDPDPREAVPLLRLFVGCRVAEAWAGLVGERAAGLWAGLGGALVLGAIGARVLTTLGTQWQFQ